MTWDDVSSIGAMVATLTTALIAALIWYDRRRSARYNNELHRSELDMMRASTERKIYELTERLLATEERWRDANHLLLDSQKVQAAGTGPEVQMNAFLKQIGLSRDDTRVDSKLVFVLTPFHPDFDETFATIRKVCADLGLYAVRGDEEFVPTNILQHVIKMLVKARLVVAVIDGRNPNVFYELGIAHALNKPTILVSSDTSLPFDLRNLKVLLADNPLKLSSMLKEEIARSLV